MMVVAALLLVAAVLTVVLLLGSWRSPKGSGARRAMVTGAAVIIAVVALGVWAVADPRTQPLEPDAPTVMGVRAEADDLAVWPGERCADVTLLTVRLTVREPREIVKLRLESNGPGVTLGPFRVRGLQEDPPEPLEQVEQWPDDVDLASFDTVAVSGIGGTQLPLAPVVDGSPDHPDEYWFGEELGWMTADEAAERDGEDFYSLCATDIRYE